MASESTSPCIARNDPANLVTSRTLNSSVSGPAQQQRWSLSSQSTTNTPASVTCISVLPHSASTSPTTQHFPGCISTSVIVSAVPEAKCFSTINWRASSLFLPVTTRLGRRGCGAPSASVDGGVDGPLVDAISAY